MENQIEQRLINIIIERENPIDEAFSPHVVSALREYADLIEKNLTSNEYDDPSEIGNDIHKVKTKNNCIIKVIAGSYSLNS